MKKGKNKLVDGVCSGISERIGFEDPIWVRLAFILGGFFWFYLVMMILMEEQDEK